MDLKNRISIIDRQLLIDDRGWFLKIINGKEKFIPDHTGEIYITNAKPGNWRANHYHLETAEWFSVIKGSSKVILEDYLTKERIELELNSKTPQTLFVPPGIAHVFINTQLDEDMILVVYSENIYDPNDTISYNLVNEI